MKLIKYIFPCVFLFAVNGYAQQFNSVLSPDRFNTIEIKRIPLKDTSTKASLLRDTLFVSQYVPEKENLQLATLPLNHIVLRSGFGYRIHPILGSIKFHNGIDLSARHDYIYSVLHGMVVISGYDDIIGNYIVINHGLYETTYGHLSIRFVKPGDLVKSGTIIGISGATGRVTGEHLHFIVKYKGSSINPLPFLKEILSLPDKSHLANFLTQNK